MLRIYATVSPSLNFSAYSNMMICCYNCLAQLDFHGPNKSSVPILRNSLNLIRNCT